MGRHTGMKDTVAQGDCILVYTAEAQSRASTTDCGVVDFVLLQSVHRLHFTHEPTVVKVKTVFRSVQK